MPLSRTCLALSLALLGCSAPQEAELPMTAAAAARPVPQLTETARFTDALAASGPTAAHLAAQRDILAAEADALRARAAALNGPLIDSATHDRLATAPSLGP